MIITSGLKIVDSDSDTAEVAAVVFQNEEGVEVFNEKLENIRISNDIQKRILFWPGNVLGEVVSPLDTVIERLVGCKPPVPEDGSEFPSDKSIMMNVDDDRSLVNIVLYSTLFPSQLNSSSRSFCASLLELRKLPDFPKTKYDFLSTHLILSPGFGTFRGSRNTSDLLNQMRLEWRKFLQSFPEEESN